MFMLAMLLAKTQVIVAKAVSALAP